MEHHLAIFFKARGASHVEAAKELGTVSAISTAPIIIGAAAFLIVPGSHAIAHDGQAIKSFSAYASVFFLRGQLFLIATSYLATAIYRLWNSGGGYSRPEVLNLFAFLLFGIIGIFYGINPGFAELRNVLTEILSIGCLFICFVAYYYMAVLSHEKPPPTEVVLQRNADRTATRLRQRRKELGE